MRTIIAFMLGFKVYQKEKNAGLVLSHFSPKRRLAQSVHVNAIASRFGPREHHLNRICDSIHNLIVYLVAIFLVGMQRGKLYIRF